MNICVSTRPSCRCCLCSDHRVVEMWLIRDACAGTREALEIAGTSINFRSGKFGYSICPFFSKGHAEFFREFWHDFAKKGTYGVLRLMHGPGYLTT